MKILLAYDGFEHSFPALEEAARLAAETDADMTVLGVVPPDARGSKSGGHVGLPPHAQEDVGRVRDYLQARDVEATTKVEHGDPADAILREAQAGEYNLLVVGSRGLGPLGRMLQGSVSRKIVRGASCDVVVAGKEGVERFERAELAAAVR